MNQEKRMAGDYEIIQSVLLGDKEIVVGENLADTNDQKYMTAFCDRNEIVALYVEILASDDYAEIMGLFGKRLTEQAEKTRITLKKPMIQGIDDTPITAGGCTPITHGDDINGKIIVIRADALRREYRKATHQIKLCKGGFGASPNSRGSACYCVDLYSGKDARYERKDVLGTLAPEQLPGWAKQGLTEYQHSKSKNNREER